MNPKTNRNDRAHDLVDLQILEREETIDYAELREISTRLFAARRAQEWPPTVVDYDDWRSWSRTIRPVSSSHRSGGWFSLDDFGFVEAVWVSLLGGRVRAKAAAQPPSLEQTLDTDP